MEWDLPGEPFGACAAADAAAAGAAAAGATDGANENFEPFGALYMHVPFCKSRCNYCDFETEAVAYDSSAIDSYVDQLILSLRRHSKAENLGHLNTVYMGGGTPSYLGQRRLASLIYALGVSADLCKEGLEFTLEANPESFDERLAKDIFALGVNRLSFGVQSFNDEVLATLGRCHNASDAKAALSAALERFENVSLDLMVGIPGQSLNSVEESLKVATSFPITHVSIYPLTIEDGTPFSRAVAAGKMPEPSEEDAAKAMDLARDYLKSAGFAHYEVANFAKPGFESKHNSAYWQGVPYLGLGRGATSMRQNAEKRQRFTNGALDEELTRPQMEAENLMLAARMSCGFSADQLQKSSLWLPGASAVVASLVSDGFLREEDHRYKPTKKGWLFGNQLFLRLMDLAE